MSSIYRIDKRNSLTYQDCLLLTIEADGAKMVVMKNDKMQEPPKEYNDDCNYGLWDGRNYLHIYFDQTNQKGKPYRASCGERYGNNEVTDLLDILGQSKWVG